MDVKRDKAKEAFATCHLLITILFICLGLCYYGNINPSPVSMTLSCLVELP